MPRGFAQATFADTLPRDHTTFAQSHIGNDPVAYLPERAADRFRALSQHVADLHALCPAFPERHEVHTEKLAAKASLDRLRAPRGEGGFGLDADDGRIVAAEQLLARLTAEAQRVDRLYEARSVAWTIASQTLAKVTSWLRDGRPGNTTLQDYDGPPPALGKNEDVMAAIARVRQHGKTLAAELGAVRSAGLPKAECKRRMREEVETLAQRGAPGITGLARWGQGVSWPVLYASSQPFATATGPVAAVVEVFDAAALFAWAHKDALLKRLDALIDAEVDDRNTLASDAKERREAEVLAKIVANDRDESYFVLRALDGKLPASHRPDISPQSLLGVALVTAPRVADGPSTTPLAYDLVR